MAKAYKPKTVKKAGVTLLEISESASKLARAKGLPVTPKPKPLETPQRKALRKDWGL